MEYLGPSKIPSKEPNRYNTRQKSVENAIDSISFLQEKIQEANKTIHDSPIIGNINTFKNIEVKILKTQEFITDLDQELIDRRARVDQLTSEVKKLNEEFKDLNEGFSSIGKKLYLDISSKMDPTTHLTSEQTIRKLKNEIFSKEKEIQQIKEGIQEIEGVNLKRENAAFLISNALANVHNSLGQLQNDKAAALSLSEQFDICKGMSEENICKIYQEIRWNREKILNFGNEIIPPEMEESDKVQILLSLQKLYYQHSVEELKKIPKHNLLDTITFLLRPSYKGDSHESISIIEELAKFPQFNMADAASYFTKIFALTGTTYPPHQIIRAFALFTEGTQGNESKMVMEALTRYFESGVNVYHAKFLADVCKAMSAKDKAMMIEAFINTPENNLKMNPFRRLVDQRSAIEIFPKIPLEERTEFFDFLLSLESKTNDPLNYKALYSSYIEIPPEEREDFSQCILKLKLFNENQILYCLLNASPKIRHDLVVFITSKSEKLSGVDLLSIIQNLANTPRSDWKDLIEYMIKLPEILKFPSIFRQVPKENWQNFKDFYESNLQSLGMNKSKDVLEIFAQIFQEKKDKDFIDFFKNVLHLLPQKTNAITKDRILVTLDRAQVPPADREDSLKFMEYGLKSFTGNMSTLGEEVKIAILLDFPKESREDFGNIMEATSKLAINNYGVDSIIRSFITIPKHLRQVIIENGLNLLNEDMSSQDVATMVKLLHLFIQSKPQQDDFVKFAKFAAAWDGKWISHYIQNFNIKDQKILIDIAKIAAEQSGEDTATYISNYNIKDQDALYEIAKISIASSPDAIRNYHYNFKLFLAAYAIYREVIQFKDWRTESLPDFPEKILKAFKLLYQEPVNFSEVYETLGTAIADSNISKFLIEFQNKTDQKKEKIEIQKTILNWFAHLSGHFLSEKITAEQVNFLLEKGFIQAVANYTDPQMRYQLTFILADLVKHKDFKAELNQLSTENLPLYTRIPLLLLLELKKEGIKLETCKELLKFVRNNAFKDGKNLKIFVNAIWSVLNNWELSVADKEFLLSKIKLPASSAIPTLHAIVAFKSMKRMSALEKNYLEKNTINTLLQNTIQALIPLKSVPDTQQFAKYFITDRSPNFLFTYAAKLSSLPDGDALLKFLGATVDAILNGDYPQIRYDLKGDHLTKIFSERPELLNEWKKGEKASLEEFLLQTDPELKPVNFLTLLREKIINFKHLQREDIPLLFEFLDQGTLQQIDGTDNLSILQKKCMELTQKELSLEEQKKLLKEINTTLNELGGKFEEFKNDIKGFHFGLIKQNEAIENYGRFTVEDTDNYLDLYLCGQEVGDSCQRVDGQADLNKCLMGYVSDGKNRMLAIKDKNGRIIARQIFRILWDGEKPVLFLEKIYPSLVNPKFENALELFAKQRAAKLGLTLLTQEGENLPLFEKSIYSLGSPAPYEYSDASGGVTTGVYENSKARILS